MIFEYQCHQGTILERISMSDTQDLAEDQNLEEEKKLSEGKSPQEEKKSAQKSDKSDSSGGAVRLAEYEIESFTRMESYDNGSIQAFKATQKKGRGNFIAYVNEQPLVPRHNRVEVYQGIINPNLAKLVRHGATYWPPAKQERYVFIYENTLGNKLIKGDEEQALGFKNDIVMERILKPISGVLQDFRDRDFVHGSIRASNIYNGGSSNLKRIVLGDCLTCPSGYNQDAQYEPIERAMADNIARGPGTRPTDMYAFGVMLAVMLRQHDPMHGFSDDAIIKRKLDIGSYAAVTGKDRFTGPILELLRGLLHDDVSQRWTIDEMLAWMDGRRLSPKQAVRKIVAPRPIIFNHKKYFQPTLLAMDFDQNPGDVKRILEEGELKNWINRAIERPELFERIESYADLLKGSGEVSNYDDLLVSYLSMAIDKDAPIRFRGLRFNPDGVGSALAEAIVNKSDLNIFADMFSHNVVLQWVKAQTNPNVDVGALVSRFDSCRMFVKQKNMGFGLERCLYLLNPEARCMSDKVKNYYVLSPEDLLGAYEDMCKKGKGSGLFIDRHIAAFISVKDGKAIDNYLPDLNAAEHYKKVLANLAVFAAIQRRAQLPYFPGIGQAIAAQLGVVYKRYHDRTIRDKLKSSVDKFAQEGDLIKMAGLLENPDVHQKDFAAFKSAMQEYDDLRNEGLRLESRLLDRSTFGLATGQEASALISSVVAGIVILFVAFLYFSDNALF